MIIYITIFQSFIYRYFRIYFTSFYRFKYLIIIILLIIGFSIFLEDIYIGYNFFNNTLYYTQCYFFTHIRNIKNFNHLSVYKYNYSTSETKLASHNESNIQSKLNDFYEWFCGFSDGESSFFFRFKPRGIEFYFKISLHKDDLPVLLYIKEKLGIGKIHNIVDNSATFSVSKQKELIVLLEIFERFPLNSTKFLNYLDFKQAFELYITSKSPMQNKTIINKIHNLKNRMNTLRTDFTLPEYHKIRINPNWLLGFTEGEGSFSVGKNMPFTLTYSLTQKNNTALMIAIQKFFDNLDINGNNQTASTVSFDNRIASKGEITSLYITRMNYIANVLIPLMDSLSWHSKKELDYKDWKSILKLKKMGLHWEKKGKIVIELIISQMNLNRLSTNAAKLSQPDRVKLTRNIDKLLNGPSNLEIKANGRIFIKSLNKYYIGGEKIKVNLLDKEGILLNSFDSISECAKFLGISAGTVKDRLWNNKPLKVDSKEFFIQKQGSIIE
uniref:Homing endonuclease LAGLIDADG domain-containing protein n=1 Tax=Orbilia brochopaga TaxID=3140254 RepID=A0A481ZMK5_9PEZI|nr:hypothetical protein [Drechslerella brochopaga]QBL02519.1 hypothetical protein [Drechslerella brochopaga]